MPDVHAQWSCAAGSGLIIDMERIHYVMFLVPCCSGFDNSILLGYDCMLTGVLFPTFEGNLLPPFSAIQEALK